MVCFNYFNTCKLLPNNITHVVHEHFYTGFFSSVVIIPTDIYPSFVHLVYKREINLSPMPLRRAHKLLLIRVLTLRVMEFKDDSCELEIDEMARKKER